MVFAGLIGISVFQQRITQQSTTQEDPTIETLTALDQSQRTVKALIAEFINTDRSLENWSKIEDYSLQTYNSVELISPDGKVYRTESINGEKVCNNRIFQGFQINQCIQILNDRGELNHYIASSGRLKSKYIKANNDGSKTYDIVQGTQVFSLNRVKVVQKSYLSTLLLLSLLATTIMLLLFPFANKFSGYHLYNFAIPGVAFLVLGWDPNFSSLSMEGLKLLQAVTILFATMYVWRKKYFLNLDGKAEKLVTTFGLTILNFTGAIQFANERNINVNLREPFKSIEQFSLGDLPYMFSILILVFAFFVSLHQFRLATKTTFQNKKYGLGVFFGLCPFLIAISYFLIAFCPLIPTILVIGILLVLTDFFSDSKQNPAIWIILWSVVLSLMMSGLIFYSSFHNVISGIQVNLENQLTESEKSYHSLVHEGLIYTKTSSENSLLEDVENIPFYFEDSKIVFVNSTSSGQIYYEQGLPSFIKVTSLFSIVFIFSIFLYTLLYLIHRKVQIFPRTLHNSTQYFSSFSRRIQISFLILTIISFLGIATTTILILNRQFNRNDQQVLQSELSSTKNHITQLLNILNADNEEFNKQVKIFEKEKDLTIILFGPNGISIQTDHAFLSSSILDYLRNNPSGSLSNKTSDGHYISFINLGSEKYPYVRIDGNSHVGKSSVSIMDFLLGILNVYVFLFIIAVTFAVFIGKSIVDPLSKLTQRMQQLRLGKNNELVEWKGEDEVADLIQKYNEMVVQLEDSAMVLAQTERDMAWREMAKQVAHEIKNPLTPMKLNIQYLQKQMGQGMMPDKEKIDRIAASLLQQINNLSNISDEFSNVAKLPTARNEKVVLNEVVESVHDLFRKREDMDIHLSVPINDMFVFADQNHLTRILNNLLKNATEAIPEDRRGQIDIKLYKKNGDAIIQISDNGTGIPKSMQEKVFTPKFTTKNSGSGLGLAIAANMIESFNGDIYFSTKENQGTDFFIKVPLMRLDMNQLDKRVYLE